jgi:hypothetical protein
MYPPVLFGGSPGYRDKTYLRIQLLQTPVNIGRHKDIGLFVFIPNTDISGTFLGMNKGVIQIAGQQDHNLPYHPAWPGSILQAARAFSSWARVVVLPNRKELYSS